VVGRIGPPLHGDQAVLQRPSVFHAFVHHFSVLVVQVATHAVTKNDRDSKELTQTTTTGPAMVEQGQFQLFLQLAVFTKNRTN
jgi:hypothetical protein